MNFQVNITIIVANMDTGVLLSMFFLPPAPYSASLDTISCDRITYFTVKRLFYPDAPVNILIDQPSIARNTAYKLLPPK